jgi:CHAD domain-containing protein
MKTPAHERVKEPETASETRFGDELLRVVGKEALRKQLANVREQIAPVRQGDDAEAVHQMRVAIRRLRTMARLLGDTPAFRHGRVTQLRRRLRPLARRLGDVRDLDILLKRLDEYECESDGDSSETAPSPDPLRNELLERRARALHDVRQTLQQSATRKLLRHPRRTARRLISHELEGRRTLVRRVAGSALWSRYEATMYFANAVAAAGPTERLHALRIACKQLRYALELFSKEDDPRTQALEATLKEAQDYLGDLQDSVFAVGLLTQLHSRFPHDPLLEGFLSAQEARRDDVRQGVAPYWERLSGPPFRQELAALIAEM